jgi:hypothetical protein
MSDKPGIGNLGVTMDDAMISASDGTPRRPAA